MSLLKLSVNAAIAISCSAFIACDSSTDDGDSADGAQTRVTAQRIINADAEPGNWLSHGRTYDEQRFSPLTLINDKNVAGLGLAWHFDIATKRGMESTPLIANGVIYVTAAWSVVYALDAKNGNLIWKYDPQVPQSWGAYACCDVVNRGVALWNDKVYVGTLDGYLVALHAATGVVRWKADTIDRKPPYTITGAPRVVDGKVVIGNGGGDYGVRGYVTAYDAETGQQVWRVYTVPGDPAAGFETDALRMAAETWTGEWWKFGGGGTAWDSFAYDPDLDLLYIGVGNGLPWNRELRSPDGGDNLFLASILAVRAKTGEYVWHYQTTPGETWDYTATQHMILADLEIAGTTRKVIMQAPKNGFFYVLDRENGKLISADPYVPLNWATHVDLETGRPVEVAGARYEKNYKIIFPSSWGAHNWHPMSYSPLTGLVYVPVIGGPEAFSNWKNFEFFENQINTGLDSEVSAAVAADEFSSFQPVEIRLSAWDPVKRREVFRIGGKSGWNAGVLSTAGNLLFQGESSGEFAAFRADTGERLWAQNINTGIMAPPVTYTVDDKQYVAVVGGWGIHIGSFDGNADVRPDVDALGRVAVFRLGGRAMLPQATSAMPTRGELPEIALSDEEVAEGYALYNERCSWCHGVDAVSSGAVPDLRYSTLQTHNILKLIVLDGAYASRGMPDFGNVLSERDLQLIQAYIISQSIALGSAGAAEH